MKYIGVPTCPYCKKRVNIIRTWSLKRQGEYRCPRCGGISNIYLSPLIYVFALLAVFGGGAMYFFHKFVLDDVSLKTILHVFIPFAAFFAISLFMVYLEKPVIKTVSKADLEKKGRRAVRSDGYSDLSFDERRESARSGRSARSGSSARDGRSSSQPMFYSDEFQPREDYRTGTFDIPPAPAVRRPEAEQPVVRRRPAAASRGTPADIRPVRPASNATEKRIAEKTGAVRITDEQEPPVKTSPAAHAESVTSRPAASRPVTAKPAVSRPVVSQRPAAHVEPAEVTAPKKAPFKVEIDEVSPAQNVTPVQSSVSEDVFSVYPAGQPRPVSAPVVETPAKPVAAVDVTRTVSETEVPSIVKPAEPKPASNDDFFSKYDDPEYVEKRLREINSKNS